MAAPGQAGGGLAHDLAGELRDHTHVVDDQVEVLPWFGQEGAGGGADVMDAGVDGDTGIEGGRIDRPDGKPVAAEDAGPAARAGAQVEGGAPRGEVETGGLEQFLNLNSEREIWASVLARPTRPPGQSARAKPGGLSPIDVSRGVRQTEIV